MESSDADPAYWSATQQAEELRQRRISAVELLDRAIYRIERFDERINAVVVRDFEQARVAARAADNLLKSNDHLPLLGIPMTIKESFNVSGLPSTWGFPQARGYLPAEDSVVAQRLKAVGAVIIGKTNVATALSDWQSFNAVYGTTNNPWDLSRSPGGSSGGSAAALAAGLVPLEVGSDLRGSLRVPAHYCGVFGHKPTHGIVPLRGHVPPGAEALPNNPDLAVAGPLARCAEDLALAMKVLAGPDIPDSIGLRLDLPVSRHSRLQDFRILVLTDHPSISISVETAEAVDQLASRLMRIGATLSRDSTLVPDLEQTATCYTRLFMSFSASFWPVETYDRVKAMILAAPADLVQRRNQRAFGAVLSHRDWIVADQLRASLRKRWQNLFQEFDVVICPTMPTVALPHDQSPDREARRIELNDVEMCYEDQDPWLTIASMCGFPSTVAPIGYSTSGLPIGVQIIAPHMGDQTSIAFAGLIEREFGGFSPPPMSWA